MCGGEEGEQKGCPWLTCLPIYLGGGGGGGYWGGSIWGDVRGELGVYPPSYLGEIPAVARGETADFDESGAWLATAALMRLPRGERHIGVVGLLAPRVALAPESTSRRVMVWEVCMSSCGSVFLRRRGRRDER